MRTISLIIVTAIWTSIFFSVATGSSPYAGGNITSDILRYTPLPHCVTLSPVIPGDTPLTLEWYYDSEVFHGRWIASAIRAGYAGKTRDGFVGVAYQGDGYHPSTKSQETLLMGWPSDDISCVETLYLTPAANASAWRGSCSLVYNATATNLTCANFSTYSNQTCNISISNLVCTCSCSPSAGCWGPAPSCLGCQDGCNVCQSGYGGSTCQIPVYTDVYEPDYGGALSSDGSYSPLAFAAHLTRNTLIQMSWLRNLTAYPNSYTSIHAATVEILWGYRHAALFNSSSGCIAEISGPTSLTAQDTERAKITLDLTAYPRLENGSCRSVSSLLGAITPHPVLHTRTYEGLSTLGTDPIVSMLKLGSSYFDHITLPSTQAYVVTPEMVQLVNEGYVFPQSGDTLTTDSGVQFTWVPSNTSDAGLWATYPNFYDSIHYWALAVSINEAALAASTTNAGSIQQIFTTVEVVHSGPLTVWFDAVQVLDLSDSDWIGYSVASDPTVVSTARSSVFAVTRGSWHQLIIKFYCSSSMSGFPETYFRIRFSRGDLLQWQYTIPQGNIGLRPPSVGMTWLSHLLHLGVDPTAGIFASSFAAFSANYLNPSLTETALEPFPGDSIYLPQGSAYPLLWTPITTPSSRLLQGVWGAGGFGTYVEYFALALFNPLNQSLNGWLTYRNGGPLRIWMDEDLTVTQEWSDGNAPQQASISLSSGWHQMLVKLLITTGYSSGDIPFKLAFSFGDHLLWSYSLPFRCTPSVCLNGGTCAHGQCVCPSGFNGEFCEHGYLFGEKFQTSRVAILYMT